MISSRRKEDFEQRYIPEPNSGCWLWTGNVGSHGYGVMPHRRSERMTLAHRASWMIHCGQIPADIHVLHRCDTPCCVNPFHLFLGTNLDNIRDMVAKGRTVRGEAKRGAKLTEDNVRYIRNSEERAADLALQYNICISKIYSIRSGHTWRYVK